MKYLQIWICLLALLLILLSCGQTDQKDNFENYTGYAPENAAAWIGAYKGFLPCEDCPGIKAVVQLKSDTTFALSMKWTGVNYAAQVAQRDSGKFRWINAGTIKLESDLLSYFMLYENRLVKLDDEGRPYSHETEADNTLHRFSSRPEGQSQQAQ